MPQFEHSLTGLMRRLILIYNPVGMLFITIVSASLGGHIHWDKWWAYLMVLAPWLLLVPGLVRLRREALQLGYGRGESIGMYLRGTSYYELRLIRRQQAQRQVAWDALLTAVAQEEPQLMSRLDTLHGVDDLDGAKAMFDRAKLHRARQARQQQEQLEACRREAVKLHCLGVVEPLLATGDIKAAGKVMQEVERLLARAKQLGLEVSAIELIEGLTSSDFSSLNQLIKQAETSLAVQRCAQAFQSRIATAPDEEQPKLQELLGSLLASPWGTREFRLCEHQLEQQLGQALNLQ